MAKQFNIGDVTTVQLGNAFDTSGYREYVPCKVLAIRDNFGKNFYLVQILDDEGFFADASVYPRSVQGELYSTSARRVREGQLETVEEVAHALGYKL